MSWLLYLPTRELADALQAHSTESTNAIVEVSGNWDTARLPHDDAFSLQPTALQSMQEPAYG
jgi:hypothetical protein